MIKKLIFLQCKNVICLVTDDTAEQAEAGGVALAGVPRTIPPGGRQRDPQANGTVKLASPRLYGHHRAERGLVPQKLGHQFIWDRLGLRAEDGGGEEQNSVEEQSKRRAKVKEKKME